MIVTEPSLPHLQVVLWLHHLVPQPSIPVVAVAEVFLKDILVTSILPSILQLLSQIRLVSLFAQTAQHFIW
jgi:hypothetical protein